MKKSGTGTALKQGDAGIQEPTEKGQEDFLKCWKWFTA